MITPISKQKQHKQLQTHTRNTNILATTTISSVQKHIQKFIGTETRSNKTQPVHKKKIQNVKHRKHIFSEQKRKSQQQVTLDTEIMRNEE